MIRPGATHVEVFNSGLEVWLYDDSNRVKIRTEKLRRALIGGAKTDGQLAGYSLIQDDGLTIDVVVGKSLTKKELSVSRWLEPQHAFLRVPSGRLTIESNDACRVGEEEPTEKGAVIKVPAGNYRLTLHRVDYEALEREEMSWTGAQEVIVLTRGGDKNDDVAGLLPFPEQLDLSWTGKLDISDRTGRGLVWFDDYWDTYFANINAAAAARMSLVPGRYLRVTVPAAGMQLLTVFAASWKEGEKLKPPAGQVMAEFGYGAVIQPERWNGNEALFCRRVKASKAIEARHKKVWLDATFETLELEPEAPPTRMRGDPLLDTGQRAFWCATLAARSYFEGDDYSLSMKLDGRVEGVTFGEALALPEAVKRIDAAMAVVELQPAGDFSFDVPGRVDPIEYTVRVYTGSKNFFAGVWASTESFEVCLFSRVNGRWVLTGTIDDDDAGRITAARPRISMVGSEDDEGTPLADIVEAHEEHLARFDREADEIPDTLQGIVALYDDYLTAAIG